MYIDSIKIIEPSELRTMIYNETVCGVVHQKTTNIISFRSDLRTKKRQHKSFSMNGIRESLKRQKKNIVDRCCTLKDYIKDINIINLTEFPIFPGTKWEAELRDIIKVSGQNALVELRSSIENTEEAFFCVWILKDVQATESLLPHDINVDSSLTRLVSTQKKNSQIFFSSTIWNFSSLRHSRFSTQKTEERRYQFSIIKKKNRRK